MNDKSTSVEIGSLKDKEKIKILFCVSGEYMSFATAQGVMQRLVDERGLSSRYELDSCGFYGGRTRRLARQAYACRTRPGEDTT